MKKHKKTAFRLGILLLLVLVVCFLGYRDSKWEIMRHIRNNGGDLEQLAQRVISAGEVSPDMKYRNYSISYWEDAPMVEFTVSGWGIGSQTSYSGFYYSPEDALLGFQWTPVTFQPDGNGWRWEESDGDNWEYVEKIKDNWYWFEMHF